MKRKGIGGREGICDENKSEREKEEKKKQEGKRGGERELKGCKRRMALMIEIDDTE